MDEVKRRLLWHAMLLFLLGLLTGLVESQFRNPRMGLAAHLEGVMNGAFLVALGAIWPDIRLTARQKTIVFWTFLYGAYGNWAFTTLAAVFGTAALSPITAAGHGAQPWQEALVTAGFATVGLAMVSASLLALWGLRKSAPRDPG